MTSNERRMYVQFRSRVLWVARNKFTQSNYFKGIGADVF